jgi:hypothetical protein
MISTGLTFALKNPRGKTGLNAEGTESERRGREGLGG